MSPNDKNTTGIIDSAREWIHTAVETEEQREAKKPLEDKIQDAIPKSTEEATQQIGDAVGGVISDIQSNFEARLNENSSGETIRTEEKEESSNGNIVNNAIGTARSKIYEATKPAEKEEKSVTEQLQDSLQETTEKIRSSVMGSPTPRMIRPNKH